MSRSVNGIPTGTTHTIAFGDGPNSALIETRMQHIYTKFTDCLWRGVCTRILTEMLRDLKAGKTLVIGGVSFTDEGVVLTKKRFLSSELVSCPWREVSYVSSGGSLYITSTKDKKTPAVISYLQTKNTHILEAMICLSFQNFTGKLSNLLS